MHEIDRQQNKALEEHIKSNIADFATIKVQLKELKDLLTPIADTYKTVGVLAKWTTASVVFISICIGIVWNLKNLLK